MNDYPVMREKRAQTAIEYMLLLAAVVAIVLVGFKTYLPRVLESSNVYLNRAGVGILGNAARCGDGVCDDGSDGFENCENCPTDCNPCGYWAT